MNNHQQKQENSEYTIQPSSSNSAENEPNSVDQHSVSESSHEESGDYTNLRNLVDEYEENEKFQAATVDKTGVELLHRQQQSSVWEEVESKTFAVDYSSVHVLTKKIAQEWKQKQATMDEVQSKEPQSGSAKQIDRMLVAQLDQSMFTTIFSDFDKHPECLQSGLVSLDQMEVPAVEVSIDSTQIQHKPPPETWFKAEIEPCVGTSLFFEVSKHKVDSAISLEQKHLKKRFQSHYSVTNYNEKLHGDSSEEESESEDSSESHQLRKKHSSMTTHHYVKKLTLKGQNEYQIALRKRHAGAKASIERVTQFQSLQYQKSEQRSSTEIQDPNAMSQRKRDQKLTQKVQKVTLNSDLLAGRLRNKLNERHQYCVENPQIVFRQCKPSTPRSMAAPQHPPTHKKIKVERMFSTDLERQKS